MRCQVPSHRTNILHCAFQLPLLPALQGRNCQPPFWQCRHHSKSRFLPHCWQNNLVVYAWGWFYKWIISGCLHRSHTTGFDFAAQSSFRSQFHRLIQKRSHDSRQSRSISQENSHGARRQRSLCCFGRWRCLIGHPWSFEMEMRQCWSGLHSSQKIYHSRETLWQIQRRNNWRHKKS